MSTAAPTSFAVAICTHQRWNDVSRCLAALSPQARALGFSILVIDSGSSPTAAGHLIELSKQYSAEYLRVDEPGLSRARNVALEYSSEEWIAFLDDDAEPHAEWASSLTELLSKASEQIAIFGGKVIPRWPDGTTTLDLPKSWLLLLSCVTSETAGDVAQGCNIVGANLVVRRQVVRAVGGFPKALGRIGKNLLSCEEAYVVEKLTRLGYRCVYRPEIAVDHHIQPERLKLLWARKRAYWEGVSRVVMFKALNSPLPRSLNPLKLAGSVPILWVWQKINRSPELAFRFEKTRGSLHAFISAIPQKDGQ